MLMFLEWKKMLLSLTFQSGKGDGEGRKFKEGTLFLEDVCNE